MAISSRRRTTRRKDKPTHSVYFESEVPGVKAGQRDVIVKRIGRVWVQFRLPHKARGHKVGREVWDRLGAKPIGPDLLGMR